MNAFRSFCLLLCGIPSLSLLSWAEPASPLHEHKQLYDVRMSQAMNLHADQMAELSKQYAAALNGSATVLQQQGDLDGLLGVKAEITRFKRTGNVPPAPPKGAHPSVVKLQAIYLSSKAKADATKGRSTAELTEKYLAYLQDLQKSLTREGKLEEALAIKAEVTRAQQMQAGMPAAPPKPGPAPEIAAGAPSLLIGWTQQRPRNLPLGCKLNPQDGNSIANDGSLKLEGGRTLLEGFNDKLLEACKKSNEWSLVAHFETDNLQQGGPARMISFSENSSVRNFSLCQENDRLVLRLRTTKTGDNGNNPQVNLGKIEQGKLHRVVVTYEPGKLGFYMDGKTHEVQQIEGDFSNWQEQQIVLGNEWKDDRSWKGTIRAFAFYSSALSERDSLAQTR